MNILIVTNHYPVCSARYATDAFIRLGHTVKHIGTPMGRNIWGGQVPEEYVWTPDGDLFNGWIGWGNPFPENQPADCVIVMDSDPAILDLLEHFGNHNSPMIVWGVDNHVRDYRRPYFDHYFLAHKSVSVMDWKAREDMTWLPCAYDPVAFPPSPIAWADRKYDVCMIGVMYPKRWELVQAMRQAGLKVFAGTGLIYDAYRDAYHNSRVALVSSACGDLPIRLFEGAGMGCIVLHDDIPDLDILDPDADWADSPSLYGYGDIKEAVERAKELQDGFIDPVANGWWLENHTWDKRAQVIISWLEAR